MTAAGFQDRGGRQPGGLGWRPSRWSKIAIIVVLGLLIPVTGAAGPQEDAARAVCDAATTAAGQAAASPARDATDTVRAAACLRFVTTYYSSGSPRTVVHPATLNVPSLIDLNNDSRPDLSAQIQVPNGIDAITMTVQRLPTASASLPVKIEAVAPVPTLAGKEAAFGYDTSSAGQAPESFVVTLRRAVDPAAPTQPRYRLEITEYTPAVAGASLSLVGALYTPAAGDELRRDRPVSARLAFSPFPPAGSSFEFASDAGGLKIVSGVRSLVDARITDASGSTTRRIDVLIDRLPAGTASNPSLSLLMASASDGRRQLRYTAAAAIGLVRVTTSGIAAGPLGTPALVVAFENLPAAMTATLPSASAPFELGSSGTIGEISVTANNISLGKYRHLYATVAGIPAATSATHKIYPPSETRAVEVAMASGSLGLVDIELTEGARLSMPSSTDGVYVRQELNPPAGRGEDAVHGRLSGLRNLKVFHSPSWFDATIDSTAGRPFTIRLDRDTTSKHEFIQGKLSSLRPNTRVSAGFGSITNTITYTAGDSVRPRLDIDTNIGDRLSLHADVPAMPRTLTACVSIAHYCMRDADKRVSQSNNAHTKAFFSLDVKASSQMTINLLDCVRKNTGTTAVCGQESYGKWVKGSITFQNLALDAYAEHVTDSWNGCDLCEPDNIRGHLFIDTDGTPVTTDINTDNTDGTDINVDLNGLRAQNRLVWFDRDWTALLVGNGFNTNGSLTCGPNPEIEFRPQIPGIDDPWINVAGYVC